MIQPTAASKGLFFLGPVMAIMPALAAWVVVPFAPDTALANINAGLLLVMAIASIEVYGVIIAGWASNSKYALLGALRASAQMVSYEIAMGFCFVVVIMVTGSMNLTEIVLGQARGTMAGIGLGFLSWNWLPLLPIFLVYLISGLPKPTAIRLTWWKARRRSWLVTWSNIRVWALPSSSWLNMQPCGWCPSWQ